MTSSGASAGAQRRVPRRLVRLGEKSVGRGRTLVGLGIVYVIAVAGCAMPPEHPPGSSAPAPVPTTTPPVSVADYDAGLRSLGQTLSTAFHGIAVATPMEPLAGHIDSVAATVSETSRQLVTIVPPPQYRTAQTDLQAALDQLANELSGLGTQVRSYKLCASQPVMATVATLPGLDALRRTAGTFGTAGADLVAALTIGESLQDRRLPNGKVLRDPGSGYGEATVENGAVHDAVFTLSQAGHVRGSLYVGHGQTARLTGIPDGGYEVFFTSGVDWDGAAFTRSCSFDRFEKLATFTTTRTNKGINYVEFSASLQPVPGGTALTAPVAPESFPK